MAAAALCDGDVKMVIWDLDGTLWRGTLDEADADDDLADGSLAPLIRLLAQRGIVSSVCSFNDEERARAALQRLGVWELIVFPAISFDSAFSKPAAIRATLSAAGLSPANALFCDDEPRHRAAAAAALPGLLTCAPSLLPPESALRRCGSADPGCSRLQKYRLLEARRRAEAAAVSQAGAGDAAAQRFLDSCEVVDLDRLVALTQRTNRLNYTRRRRGCRWGRTTPHLPGACTEPSVYVSDRFGEHGLAGLVAVRRGALRHFLFSCRLLGLHVEDA
ncbi:hypothetical protein EMIHUDRAFT_194997 [Emiliania huxleyi CCMP1516]|uniref:Uncharacterized protein n=2 Tax=Emiliania huxleyi TaxID=2903 RepID=A0A0D3JGR1_EMIH1|nr:hypothetical protein EMIHUDRAFT_194997 [Emiliania huxleyi CCMP1516]EOD22696.1 hypothetical protein EMIHUDRAFT_194997 [Emiliania huxleyi CCMP1516]|eukprot:XP_005775125.1 hypothetical protein EMIHUDRAFT_194997 [Emiliania huxleyi CCMP1516]